MNTPLPNFDLPDTFERKQRERLRSDRGEKPFEALTSIELHQRVRAERAAAIGEVLADVIVDLSNDPKKPVALLEREQRLRLDSLRTAYPGCSPAATAQR